MKVRVEGTKQEISKYFDTLKKSMRMQRYDIRNLSDFYLNRNSSDTYRVYFEVVDLVKELGEGVFDDLL